MIEDSIFMLKVEQYFILIAFQTKKTSENTFIREDSIFMVNDEQYLMRSRRRRLSF